MVVGESVWVDYYRRKTTADGESMESNPQKPATSCEPVDPPDDDEDDIVYPCTVQKSAEHFRKQASCSLTVLH